MAVERGGTIEPDAVHFNTVDGLSLVGMRFGQGPVWVVLGHMRPSDMTSWFDFAREVADAGHTALAYNNRGYGDSDGVAEQYRVDLDATAAIAFARSQGAERIFYVGASMNGTAALYVGAREDLAGIATLSGVPTFAGTDGLGSVPNITPPKLFIAALDHKGKAAEARQFFAAAAEPRQLLLFKEGGHGTDILRTNREELTTALLEFIEVNR